MRFWGDKCIAISCGKKIAKYITTGYLLTSKIALVMRIQEVYKN